MLKALGLILIIVSGTGIGYSLGMDLTRMEKHLEMLLRMTILLKGEIRYGNASLYDSFTGAAAKMQGEYKEFLSGVAEEMEKHKGEAFGDIFRKCARDHFQKERLTEEERDRFYSLGEHLGYLDLDMQMKQLELFEEDIEYSIKKLQKDLPARKKAYRSLGLLLGILLAVVVW